MDPAGGILITGIDPHPGSQKSAGIDPHPGSHASSGIDPHPGNPSQPVPNGLVMQALANSRAALSRPDVDNWFQPQRKSGANLWQLEPEDLVTVVQKQVGQRLMVVDQTLWLTKTPGAQGAMPSPALKLLTMRGPDTSKSAGLATLKAQTDVVLWRAEERSDRSAEIQVQANNLWPFFSAITYVVPTRSPRTSVLLTVVGALVSAVAQQFKHQIGCPRPVDCSAAVQPIITTPSHASLPSGHSAAAYAMQMTLQALLGLGTNDGQAVAMRRLARRIADNRVVAGLHFPMDSCAGWVLARTVVDVVMALAQGGKIALERGFDADFFGRPGDARADLPASDIDFAEVPGSSGHTSKSAAQTPINDLAILWQEAQTELSRQRPAPPPPASPTAKASKRAPKT